MGGALITSGDDGATFGGWQRQRCGQSLQESLEKALERSLKARVRVASSGRTDAGVHARAQYFHVDVPVGCRMPLEAWLPALNSHLPEAVRVYRVREVGDEFHSRFNAEAKTYEYLMECRPVPSPFNAGRTWHLPHAFDVEALEAALKLYEGEHDFRMFAARRGNEPEPVPADYYIRHIFSATLQREPLPVAEGGGEMLRLRLRGNGFMYRMVRLLVGTAHQVARGRMTMACLQAMLDAPDEKEKTRYCAPAAGLYLDSVEYQLN